MNLEQVNLHRQRLGLPVLVSIPFFTTEGGKMARWKWIYRGGISEEKN